MKTVNGSSWITVPFEVQRPHDGWRLDRYLADRLQRYSRGQIQKLIMLGRVRLRGRLAKASARVVHGEIVSIVYPRSIEPPLKHEQLDIIYEDNDLLAVNKPAGVLSHPTDKIVANTVTGILKKQFPELMPRLAHRLDRETSGVLLLAKNAAMARGLMDLFIARRVEKEYIAVVAGQIEWSQRIVDVPLGAQGGEIRVRQASGQGCAATTEFEIFARGADFSIVLARPRTGRLHQIRAHLAHIGHPVLGDKLYMGEGAAYLKAVNHTLTQDDLSQLRALRQLLHARRIILDHPRTGIKLTLRSPEPEDFQSWMERATKIRT